MSDHCGDAPGLALVIASRKVAARARAAGLPADLSDAVASAAGAVGARAATLLQASTERVDVAAHDAAALAVALNTPTTAKPVVVVLAGRYVEAVHAACMAADELLSCESAGSGPVSDDPAVLQLSQAYGVDAARERAAARSLRLAGAAALAGATAAAVWSAAAAGDDGRWARAAGPLMLCAATCLAGLFLLRGAAGRDRAGREYVRLQRGLAGLGAYLAPLPGPARHLLRATLAQTLFPRLLDDDDPLRQPEWPDSRDLLYAVYGVQPPHDDEPAADAPADPTTD